MGRILCLDYGSKRVGIAVSDPLKIFAKPLSVLPREENFVSKFSALVREISPEKLVLGMPYDLEGRKTQKCEEVEKFAELLKSCCDVPIDFYDEAFSSVNAREKLGRRGISDIELKNKLDMYAAAEILDNYLEGLR